jgi:WD40 repeat protein
MMHRLKLHKVLIQSLSFSFDEKYLASLGGQDDSTLVIWDVRNLLLTLISFLNLDRIWKSTDRKPSWNEYRQQSDFLQQDLIEMPHNPQPWN